MTKQPHYYQFLAYAREILAYLKTGAAANKSQRELQLGVINLLIDLIKRSKEDCPEVTENQVYRSMIALLDLESLEKGWVERISSLLQDKLGGEKV